MAATISFDSAHRALRRDQTEPVYYLTGDQELLKDEIIKLIVDRTLDPEGREFNFDVRSASDLDGESFFALVETPPMLAERRVVVVKGVELWRKNAAVWKVVHQYLENPSPSTVLVLVQGPGKEPHKTVAKISVHIAVGQLTPDRLQRWIGVRAKNSGFSLTGEAAEHLVNSVGPDLSHLAMEIDKLSALASDGDEVNTEAVAALVGVRRGETLRDWVSAILDRDIPRAVGMLESVLAGTSVNGVRMVIALGPALIGVSLAVALVEKGMSSRRIEGAVFDVIRAARPAGLGNWKQEATLWAKAAERWTAHEITAALRSAYECDLALKSTTLSDERGILSTMLFRMSTTRDAA